MLGAEMLRRPRLSRIYYGGKFFDYPLKPMNALTGLGVVNAVRVLLSYLWIRVRPIRPEVSFEEWVTNRFGRRLYRSSSRPTPRRSGAFRATDRRAVGRAAHQGPLAVHGDHQHAASGALRTRGDKQIKTLIDEFEYPRLGPGMMWEAFAPTSSAWAARVELEAPRPARSSTTAPRSPPSSTGERDTPARRRSNAFISTMPLRELVEQARSAAAARAVRAAAERLNYRDFLTVALVVDAPTLFPDNWIYVHDPRVKLGRIQNFKNWSPDMVPDQRRPASGSSTSASRATASGR